jgi:hypothetical protein
VAALVRFIVRRRRLEIGAGEVVQQNLERGGEQILPARPQMGKQRRLVGQQLVEAAIQRILGDQPIILAQQIRHRALFEPLPMQPPLAAGIDQPIAHQRLHDVLPAGALA